VTEPPHEIVSIDLIEKDKMKLLLITFLLVLSNIYSEDIVESRKLYPFTAYVLEVDVANTGNDTFTPCYSYKWEDFLKNKKTGIIRCGFNANWIVSTVITSVEGDNNPLSIGDSLCFIVHSPAQLSIDRESLPRTYSFELDIEFEDSGLVSFNLWSGGFSSVTEDNNKNR